MQLLVLHSKNVREVREFADIVHYLVQALDDESQISSTFNNFLIGNPRGKKRGILFLAFKNKSVSAVQQSKAQCGSLLHLKVNKRADVVIYSPLSQHHHGARSLMYALEKSEWNRCYFGRVDWSFHPQRERQTLAGGGVGRDLQASGLMIRVRRN